MDNIEAWAGILVQIPVVAVFVYFSMQMTKNFLAALDKRDASYEVRNKAMCDAITGLNQIIGAELAATKASAAASAISSAQAAAQSQAQSQTLAELLHEQRDLDKFLRGSLKVGKAKGAAPNI